jgi:hydrogenase-1 operon protein HyaF
MNEEQPLGYPVGPGSQPAEPEPVEYMPLPSEMNTFRAPILPEPEAVAHLTGARTVMEQLAATLARYHVSQPPVRIALDDLDADNLALVAQTLGDGEVKIMAKGKQAARFQESVLAGVWHVQRLDEQGNSIAHWLEVGAVPSLVTGIAQSETAPRLKLQTMPEDLMNAPAILKEIADHQVQCQPGQPAHSINLILLPISEADQSFLIEQLGNGPITILSKGYGNCRISSADLCHTWWVRYYNAMDHLILNSIEIVDIPQVACAAQEDIEDSAKRLTELLKDYLHWG